jgi:hypothetical protein
MSLYKAVDKWGRELKEGDTVITQGRLAQFSHCTAKRIMVRIPCTWGPYDGFKLIQRYRNDVQKFVPELEDDFLQLMAESKFDSRRYKKEREEEKRAWAIELEEQERQRLLEEQGES